MKEEDVREQEQQEEPAEAESLKLKSNVKAGASRPEIPLDPPG
ncbi:MAG TPA: hypothetical protein VJS44_07690 [Pyrinomonadaceae bacterium]|nr:hypothetical protein [Pyrinomonadaceae bacterium]